VGFVVDKEALEEVFSKYFCFPCQSFHLLLHAHHHHPSSRTGTTGQMVACMPSGLNLDMPQEQGVRNILLFIINLSATRIGMLIL
jgi:hypothetical protein